MSHTSRRDRKGDHYNEDGLRVTKLRTKDQRLEEKRLRNALHRRSHDFSDLYEEDEDDANPHWLFRDER